MAPSPCCNNSKRGGSAIISTSSGLWNCWACGAKGNWYGFTIKAGHPLDDAYEGSKPVKFDAYESVRAKLRRPVAAGHHPALLAHCTVDRRILPGTLEAWRVSTAGPDALRWPLMAVDPDGKWKLANARIRKVLRVSEHDTRDWFEVKGGETQLAMGNHLLGVEPAAWRENRPSWAGEWVDPTRNTPDEAKRLESPVPSVRRVLVTEGQWDAMTAWQIGLPNVLSVPNGANSVDVNGLLRFVPSDAEVWLAVDMDAQGDRCAEAFFAQLGGDRLKRLNLPVKDLNDWLKDNPSLSAEDVLATAVDKPKKSQWVDLMEPELALPSEIVATAPWTLLNTRLGGGFRGGQTTGLLAPSGTGKTTLANNIIVHLLKQRVKVGLIALEGARCEVTSTLVRQAKGWIRPDMDEELPGYMKNLLLSHLSGKVVTLTQTIEEAEQMMKDGAKMVVVDNWDYITPNDGHGHKIKAQAYAQFQELCKTWDCHGFVVWQPHKIDRAETVNSGSQKGLSTALQDADVYMTLNKRGLARRLEVEKTRGVAEVEGMASVIMLRYDAESSCLDESASQADLIGPAAKPELDEF